MDITEQHKQIKIIAKNSYDEFWGDDDLEMKKGYVSGYISAIDNIGQVLLLDQESKVNLINSLMIYYGLG